MRGGKPKPTALKVLDANPGRRPLNDRESVPPPGMPSCSTHLSPAANAEWERLADTLQMIGLLSHIDRAALAAYCQSYGRWVEAEQKLKKTPPLIKTPSGYVQQSP